MSRWQNPPLNSGMLIALGVSLICFAKADESPAWIIVGMLFVLYAVYSWQRWGWTIKR